MNGTPFKLGTFAKQGGAAFAAIVLDDDVVDLKSARGGKLTSTDSIDGLLDNWDANFAALQEIVAALEKEGRPGRRQACQPACAAAGRPPRQDVLCRAEFPGARRRDAARRHDAGDRPEIHRREIDLASVSVPQGAEHAGRRL